MAFTVITESSATRIAVAGDDEAFIEFTNAAPTYDVRTDTTQFWVTGTVISGTTRTGELTINPNTSVNINSATANITVPVDYQFTLVNPGGDDEWYCSVYPQGAVTTGSLSKSWSMTLFRSDADCAVGDGTLGFCVPASMDGMNVTDVVATAHTAGTTGTMDVQIRRRRNTTDVDVLSTKLTIDTTEVSSIDAAAAHAVNTSNDDLLEGDLIYIDVDAVQTTPAKGLTVTVTAETP